MAVPISLACAVAEAARDQALAVLKDTGVELDIQPHPADPYDPYESIG